MFVSFMYVGLSAMLRGAENKPSFIVTDYKEDQIEHILQTYFTS